jgi:4-hydroxybenzoate polyprenyltransferase
MVQHPEQGPAAPLVERTEAGREAVPPGSRLHAHMQIVRLDHMVKQLFILPGVVLACTITRTHPDAAVWRRMALGLVAATLIASSNYVINEMLDAPFDRLHPTKKNRPAACGLVHFGWGYVQWIAMMAAGMSLASLISRGFMTSAGLFGLMGCIYNIRPVRSKDLPYVDVLSEALNNPIRFSLGWYTVTQTVLPPVSLLISYWMLGAYFMGLKRFSEFRQIGDRSAAARYRMSFRFYSEESLLNSVMFYASAAMLFLGGFVMRYRIELILAFPMLAWTMAVYFGLSFGHESAVQNPEKLYRVPSLMVPVFLCIVVCTLLLWVDIPLLTSWFPKSAP